MGYIFREATTQLRYHFKRGNADGNYSCRWSVRWFF